jgi:hypothetical protein
MEDNMEVGQPEAPVESKTYTDIQVNDIVKREKARAAERARKEAEDKYKAELERMNVAPETPMRQEPVDTSDIEKRVYEKFLTDLEAQRDLIAKEEQERHLKSIADKYHLKMGKGSELFDDFNEVVADFEAHQFPNAVMLAASMDNTPEIIYELAKNPSKLQEIDSLAQKSPKLAQKQLERLSESINKNLMAKVNNVSAPPPLSRPKSSSVGVDSGKMTLEDYKKAPWLRA